LVLGFFDQFTADYADLNDYADYDTEWNSQPEINVSYKGEIIGTHRLDLLVEGCVVVELKAVNKLIDAHSATVLSYLTASGLSVALLLNFSKPSLEYKRLVRNHN